MTDRTAQEVAAGLTCPICGEGDNFDQGGLVRHIDRYCNRADELREEWAEQDRASREDFIRRRVEPIAEFAASIKALLEKDPSR